MGISLAIETSCETCSVALFDNERLISVLRQEEPRKHVSDLSGLVQSILSHQKPDFIAISQGPGSYTGLRVGMSTAKGLAYAWKIPLLSIPTLGIIYHRAYAENPALIQQSEKIHLGIDARRMEFYHQSFLHTVLPNFEPDPCVTDEAWWQEQEQPVMQCFLGTGIEKLREMAIIRGNFQLYSCEPDAAHMGTLIMEAINSENWADLAYSEPLYGKSFQGTKSK